MKEQLEQRLAELQKHHEQLVLRLRASEEWHAMCRLEAAIAELRKLLEME